MSATLRRYKAWHQSLPLRKQLLVTGAEVTALNTAMCTVFGGVIVYWLSSGVEIVVLMWLALEMYAVSRLLEISLKYGDGGAEEVGE